MQIDRETRSQINQTDCENNQLIEYLEELSDTNYEIDSLIQSLYDVQTKITELQENQGWI